MRQGHRAQFHIDGAEDETGYVQIAFDGFIDWDESTMSGISLGLNDLLCIKNKPTFNCNYIANAPSNSVRCIHIGLTHVLSVRNEFSEMLSSTKLSFLGFLDDFWRRIQKN